MPLYEYACDKCGKRSEILQKFTDAPVEVCEECGGHLTKLMSRTSFQLKGTGWYASDYKKPPVTTASPASTPTSNTTSGAGSGDTKASPAATVPAAPAKPSGGDSSK